MRKKVTVKIEIKKKRKKITIEGIQEILFYIYNTGGFILDINIRIVASLIFYRVNILIGKI